MYTSFMVVINMFMIWKTTFISKTLLMFISRYYAMIINIYDAYVLYEIFEIKYFPRKRQRHNSSLFDIAEKMLWK